MASRGESGDGLQLPSISQDSKPTPAPLIQASILEDLFWRDIKKKLPRRGP